MSALSSVAQLLTAGGVGAFGASLVRMIPALRKTGAEKRGLEAGAAKTRAELDLEMVEASREQVAFLRAELAAMRAEFVASRAEFEAALLRARQENEELAKDLASAREELSRLRGVVAALSDDVDATRTELGGRGHTGGIG